MGIKKGKVFLSKRSDFDSGEPALRGKTYYETSFKKITAAFLAAVVTFGALCTSTFAEEVSEASVNASNSYNVDFRFTNVKKRVVSITVIKISTAGSYRVTFGGTSEGSGAKIDFCKLGDKTYTPIESFSIPPYFGGMPATLTTHVDLEPGDYRVTIEPSINNGTTTGGFTIYGVAKTYEFKTA